MTIDKAKRPPMWRVVQDGKDPVWDAWPSKALGWPELRIEGNSEEDAIAMAHATMERIVAPYIAAELRRLAELLDDTKVDVSVGGDVLRARADEIYPPRTEP